MMKRGGFHPFSRYGCTYKEWFNNLKKPVPIESLHCPYMHTQQGLQSHDVNNLYKTRCMKKGALGIGCMISSCGFFKDKKTCWEIYNK